MSDIQDPLDVAISKIDTMLLAASKTSLTSSSVLTDDLLDLRLAVTDAKKFVDTLSEDLISV